MSNQVVVFLLAVLTLISAVWCEIVSFENCGDNAGKCTVHEVRVDPCVEAAEKKPCKMRRGKNAAISVDYTPSFASDTLYGQAYWPNGIMDLPLAGMETDACKTTPCPLVAGNKQTYTYDLKLSRAFPTGIFQVKWKLTGADENDECCFMFKIHLK